MNMKNLIALILVCMAMFSHAQKVHVENGKMVIDTTIVLGESTEDNFKTIKKWCVKEMSSFNDMVKGEVSPELIKLLKISRYWAAAGTRQDYSHDLIFALKGNEVQISLINFKTYSAKEGVSAIEQAEKSGWSGDKFFINKKGELKDFPKFYADVEQQFRELVISLSKEFSLALN